MKIILLIYKLKEKTNRIFRKIIFKQMIGCKHNDFRILGKIYMFNKNIIIGKNVTIYPGVMFWGNGKIIIGDNCDIGKDTIIYSSSEGGVKIDNNTIIVDQSYIIDMDHGIKKMKNISEQQNSVEKIEIGRDRWLAANVSILKGTLIEDGAIIGAKSLVKGKIKSNTINVGIPAKKIKYRE